jgi:hypothetical protein
MAYLIKWQPSYPPGTYRTYGKRWKHTQALNERWTNSRLGRLIGPANRETGRGIDVAKMIS